MERRVRCQGVILKDNCILVLRQYNHKRNEEYWLLPGGNLEEGETTEECVIREILEETNLKVKVKEILFYEDGNGKDEYKKYVTFLCIPLQDCMEKIGQETAVHRKILELVWCSIVDESKWNKYLLSEQFFPSMAKIKEQLEVKGYVNGEEVAN